MEQLYINCVIGGILGMLFHLFAVKLPAVKKRATAANLKFNIKDYFKDDYLALISNVLMLVILVWALDEIVGYNPSFIRGAKFFFIFVGYTGSSFLIDKFGKYDKTTNKIVDEKTNIADSVALKVPSNEN